MQILTIGVIGVLVVVFVTTIAPKIGVASPLVLVLVGIGISFLPITPIEVEPEFILGGVLPPLLYSSAVNTPTMEFRRDLGTISVFAVLLVVVSALGVGWMLTLLVPGLNLWVGIAIGAVVSPTDAVATSIVRKAGVSPRIVTVLEGEALFNDASSLVLLRSAIVAFSTGFAFWPVLLDFCYAVAVALVIGFVVGHLHVLVRSRIPQIASSVALSLVIPYVAYVPAEHLNASGLVAAVVAGLITGHRTPKHLAADVRIAEQAVWRTAELLLESAVFLLMGMQFSLLLDDVRHDGTTEWKAVLLGLAATTVVMVTRTIFVAAAVGLLSRRAKKLPAKREQMVALQERLGRPDPGRAVNPRRINRLQEWVERQVADLDYLAAEQFNWKDGVIMVSAGMRGAITLAAAQSLPLTWPNRGLLMLTAFTVAAGTLLIQGASLKWVVKLLDISGRNPDSDAEALVALRSELAAAALSELDNCKWTYAGKPYSEEMINQAREMLLTAIDPDDELTEQAAELAALRLEVVEAQRAELLRIRNRGTYPSELLDAKLAQLDADQIQIELRRG
jgi:CPA1 family monovalent cation:H+ antiporter